MAALAFGLSVIAGASAEGFDDDYHFGIVEYEISCAPCHGLDGRGGGPLAEHLTPAPADLTQISLRNDGQFPAIEIFEIIDGRALVEHHGERAMPVWGDRYRIEVPDDQDRVRVETEALARVAALVRYLKSLQQE